MKQGQCYLSLKVIFIIVFIQANSIKCCHLRPIFLLLTIAVYFTVFTKYKNSHCIRSRSQANWRFRRVTFTFS